MEEIEKIATLIKSGQIRRIVVLVGAGISTAAGIPDFRSPETGIYDRLKPLGLPYPEAIFHINYFRHTPEPFYAIARARHPRTLKPTITHAFLALLAKKNLLHFLFTQNIDGLERDTGVPENKILNAHGSWRTQHCWKCKTSYPDDLMKEAIAKGVVPYCQVPDCGGPIKPDVVFFGQSLPAEFEDEEKKVPEADLMIVMGTSLKVAPCSRLPGQVREGVPRVLINREKAGDVGVRPNDLCILGDCDDGVRKLADILGWTEEMEDVWEDAVAAKEATQDDWGEEESLDELIDKYAKTLKDSRKVSEGHKRMLEEHLGQKFADVLNKNRAA
ncbi:SIR2 family NAD-dependent protein deacylase [Aspergillus clavatus NRRL 1]|uniref:NAD-dependent protein deacetylase n=1 Tax=Aspergillus clavatus (strain ATCC 1007 / CBS 513.65 / DSM 816 / NCTC 3887 / NRRL 1 / QM 1276 / 107) TaxID=344612 RepID=A1CD03_ASPCL|nr:SIR2 family histone deacetylase, putative [Aspergillus clavatus NRRL 1]EAW12410.1 SIR2 family histone deacetylase, putative [Aspergillus clavatus NRRL 1]